MAYVHVAHDCQVGNHTIFANAASIAGHVHVGDHAVLGGFTGVHQFVLIGAHSMTAGATLLLQDLPPYVMAAATPPSLSGSTPKPGAARPSGEQSRKAWRRCPPHDVRREVLQQQRWPPRSSNAPDQHELVTPVTRQHRWSPTWTCPRDRGGVREDRVVADLAVVRDVHVRQIQLSLPMRVTPASCAVPQLNGRTRGSVAVADLQPRRLAGVFLVLRLSAERAVGKMRLFFRCASGRRSHCRAYGVPSPISTCSPMMEYGPTDTPARASPRGGRSRSGGSCGRSVQSSVASAASASPTRLAQRISAAPADAVGVT